jgi:hypothetical protein
MTLLVQPSVACIIGLHVNQPCGGEKELQSNISNLPMGMDAFGALSVTCK